RHPPPGADGGGSGDAFGDERVEVGLVLEATQGAGGLLLAVAGAAQIVPGLLLDVRTDHLLGSRGGCGTVGAYGRGRGGDVITDDGRDRTDGPGGQEGHSPDDRTSGDERADEDADDRVAAELRVDNRSDRRSGERRHWGADTGGPYRSEEHTS